MSTTETDLYRDVDQDEPFLPPVSDKDGWRELASYAESQRSRNATVANLLKSLIIGYLRLSPASQPVAGKSDEDPPTKHEMKQLMSVPAEPLDLDLDAYEGHTPGPLEIRQTASSGYFVFDRMSEVAVVYYRGLTSGGQAIEPEVRREQHMTAKLFAASPAILSEARRLSAEVKRLEGQLAWRVRASDEDIKARVNAQAERDAAVKRAEDAETADKAFRVEMVGKVLRECDTELAAAKAEVTRLTAEVERQVRDKNRISHEYEQHRQALEARLAEATARAEKVMCEVREIVDEYKTTAVLGDRELWAINKLRSLARSAPSPAAEPATASPSCELCGHPMPKGEEMFKFHGYSGGCPVTAAEPAKKVLAMKCEKCSYEWSECTLVCPKCGWFNSERYKPAPAAEKPKVGCGEVLTIKDPIATPSPAGDTAMDWEGRATWEFAEYLEEEFRLMPRHTVRLCEIIRRHAPQESEPGMKSELALVKYDLEASRKLSGELSAKIGDIYQITGQIEGGDEIESATRLRSEVVALKARLAEIDAGARADEADLEKMRDGTKLSRSGLVQVCVYLRQDCDALKARVAELEAEAVGYRACVQCRDKDLSATKMLLAVEREAHIKLQVAFAESIARREGK